MCAPRGARGHLTCILIPVPWLIKGKLVQVWPKLTGGKMIQRWPNLPKLDNWAKNLGQSAINSQSGQKKVQGAATSVSRPQCHEGPHRETRSGSTAGWASPCTGYSSTMRVVWVLDFFLPPAPPPKAWFFQKFVHRPENTAPCSLFAQTHPLFLPLSSNVLPPPKYILRISVCFPHNMQPNGVQEGQNLEAGK